MNASARTETFSLCEEDIDDFSAWIGRTLDEMGVDRRNRTRVRLVAETLLLRMLERLEAGIPVSVAIERRLTRTRVRMEVAGEPFNPLSGMSSELGEWESSLSTAVGLVPQYGFVGGSNVIKIALPAKRMNPVVRMTIAIALGIVLGLVGTLLIPAYARQGLVEVVLAPTYNMWSRLLTAISAPIIFLTVVTTMLNTRRIDESGGNSLLVIANYFMASVAIAALTLLVVVPLFHINVVNTAISHWELAQNLLDALLSVVPENIVHPFAQSDTAQLLFLALGFGFLILRLGDRVAQLRGVVREANEVGLELAGWVSWLVPVLTGLFICLEVWEGRINVLVILWKPMGMAVLVAIATIVVALIVISRLFGVRLMVLGHKLWGPFSMALRSGSLDDSFAEAQRSCTKLLGINSEYVRAVLPQGLVLFMPASAVGTVVFTLFVADEFNVEGSLVWYLSAVVMAVVVFVATPPVPGANLLAYMVLFSTLGNSSDALLDAMTFDIVFGIFANAANQTMLQLAMLYQASRFGLVDLDVLRSADVSRAA